MAYWAVVVPAERYAAERLFQYDALGDVSGPAPGDLVVLAVEGAPPAVFGLGRADGSAVAYTRRGFDAPAPAAALAGHGPGAYPLDEAAYAALAATVGADIGNREWLVSVDLPIEAPTPAEAVRAFWTYVTKLGPRELPAFVAPVGDELAMQAYVLGELTNLDPEEDSEE